MNIAVIAAMECEIDFLLKNVNIIKEFSRFPYKYYEYIEGNNHIFFGAGGVGKDNAAAFTAFILSREDIDLVISIGLSGSINTKIGSLCVPTRFIEHDFKVEFPLETSTVSYQYPADVSFKSFVEKNYKDVVFGTFLSGDCFATNIKDLNGKETDDTVSVDMEAASVAHISKKFKVPVTAIRIITDNLSGEDYSQNEISFSSKLDEFIKKLLENYKG